ncbi:unnamed protein product [Staurois parvus]|uniref:Beta-defensin n=1 Tax=Staurois parvus TaxID=386267 RepID=A0ABN9H873_9NEOB|nr:unnamed protein product [Staurois parvus]
MRHCKIDSNNCCGTSSPIMPLPLGIMLVMVSLAMPHGTCSSATPEGPPAVELQVPSCLCLWESCL